MYKFTTLDNGLRVLSHRIPKMDSVCCGIWIKAGSRYEKKEEQGIAHFLEHLVFKGTQRYTARKLKESVEGIGGSLNGFTAEEFSCYLVKVLGDKLPLALDVLSDMVINPLLKPGDVRKEKDVIIEELKMYRDMPAHHVHDILDSLMWPGHPLGRPLVGTLETIEGIKRGSLSSFKNSLYTPSNIAIIACGAVNESELTKQASRYFGKLPSGSRQPFEKVQVEQKAPKVEIFFKETEQTHLAMGMHSYSRSHPMRHALNLLHIILGGNMSSRLFWQIREKRGLAYEISTQVVRFNDSGVFLVNAGVDNKKTARAVEFIIAELRKIKKELVSEDEFRRAKEFYRGQFLMGLEDTADFMLWLGENLIGEDALYAPDEVLQKIAAVKRSDVYDAANELLTKERLSVAMVGPISGKDKKKIEEIICG